MLYSTARCEDNNDLGVSAIVNLTNSIQQFLTRTTTKCYQEHSNGGNQPAGGGFSEMIQLLLTQQILLQSSQTNYDKKSSRLDKMQRTIDKILDEAMSQGKSLEAITSKLSRLTTKLNTLQKAVINDSNYDNTIEYRPVSTLLHSCQEIKRKWPDSESDYYMIADSAGHNRHVYCHMETICNSDDGWARVGYLNMSDSTEKCPPGLRLYEKNGIRACGRPKVLNKGHCESTFFSTARMEYSEVCGRIIGYQYGTPGGINPYGHASTYNIDSYYTEGVSLTHGSPRKHIWTFINSHSENIFITSNGRVGCPCAPNSGIRDKAPPTFVGQDYFCESGSPGKPELEKLYTNDPLWDGQQCGLIETTCCKIHSSLPWFHKTLATITTDNIEMRVCGNNGIEIEDSPVSLVEIYVK